MPAVLAELAHLSSLRDRQALEDKLCELVYRMAEGSIRSARLVCAIGTPGQQHWQIRSAHADRPHPTQRELVWVQWSHLPVLQAFPMRLAAWEAGSVVHQGGNPFTSIFPISNTDAIPCVMELDTTAPLPGPLQQDIGHLLQIYANLIGLLDYGEKDALTGLLNRKSFDSAFVRAAQQTALTPRQDGQAERRHPGDAGVFWLAMLDIDHFKRINDTYGHLIGDEVLVLLAWIMRTSLRVHDQLYRFGGEEFVILLHCPHSIEVQGILERFRATVEAFSFAQVGQVTVSIGLTQLRVDDTPDLAFNRVDRALYHAKNTGRNRVCSFADLVAEGQILEPPAPKDSIDFF